MPYCLLSLPAMLPTVVVMVHFHKDEPLVTQRAAMDA